jgi:hypothetical protein
MRSRGDARVVVLAAVLLWTTMAGCSLSKRPTAAESPEIHAELVGLAVALGVDLASGIEAPDTGERSTTIAILPFTSHEGVTDVGEHLARDLLSALVTQVGKAGPEHVEVVSREHLDELLSEQSLSLSDIFEEGPTRLLGRLKAADLLVTGTLTPAGSETHLSTHVLRVSDGVVLGAYNTTLHVPAGWRFHADDDADGDQHGGEWSEGGPRELLEVHQANPYVFVPRDQEAYPEIEVIFWVGDAHSHAALPGSASAEEHDGPGGEEHEDDGGMHAFIPLEQKLGSMDHRALDFCLMLDTSGSMADHGRLEFAKRAARKALRSLDGDDRFSLITFSSTAQVLVGMGYATEGAKQAAYSVIDSLVAEGKTNFEQALEEVNRLYRRYPQEKLRTRYALFVSDGEPTVATDDPYVLGALAHQIADLGISVHSLGVGHELRIETLEMIATHGNGRLHVVEDAHSLEDFLPQLVGDVLAHIADNATLTFRPAPGVDVVIKGSGWRRAFDDSLSTDLGLIRRGEVVPRILHVEVSSGLQPGEAVVAGEATLSYVDAGGLRRTERAVIAVEATSDDALYREHLDLAIIQESHAIDLRATLRLAYDLATKGQREAAVLQLREALEHVEHVLEAHRQDAELLGPLARLADRSRAYWRSLERGELPDDLRIELYRDAMGLSD